MQGNLTTFHVEKQPVIAFLSITLRRSKQLHDSLRIPGITTKRNSLV